MENSDIQAVEQSGEEIRRLRSSVQTANLRTQFYADQLAGVIAENEVLRERLVASQNQMRIMRHSVVWRAGGALRGGKRFAGVVVRNIIGMIRQ